MDPILTGVIVGGLLTLAAPLGGFLWARIVERRNDQTEAVHVGLCAALALESFAVTCWPSSYSGQDHAQRTGEPIRNDIPELRDMPSALDWKGHSVEIADAVMSLHNRIDAASVIAQHSTWFENNPFAFDTEVTAKGKEAWLLAERIRRKYHLPPQTELRKSLRSMLD